MREFNFNEFYNNVQKDLSKAYEFIAFIERYEYYEQKPSFGIKEELQCNKESLVETLELIKLKFDFAYEFLNLNKLSDQLNEKLKKYDGKFDKLNCLSFTDCFYSPVLWILSMHLNSITSHIKIDNESEYATTNLFVLLERILNGTPKILKDRSVEPSNEAEVRKEVYNTLIHVFPDTVREIPISKVSKVYKPDIGIRSLKSAIEYKFVDSEQEAKTAIGGIFEDISGYEGSNDWSTFYAVIYMTDHFMTQPQIEAEFKLSKAPHNWKLIPVYGRGKRACVQRAKKKENGT